MVTKEDIESFLDRIDSGTANVGEVKPGTWVVKTVAGAEVVVHYAPPVVILRVTVMTLPAAEPRRSELLRELLELNARDLVHGAYGIEEESIVMTEALELAHLDYEEFLAAYESITVALASHLRELGSYREAH